MIPEGFPSGVRQSLIADVQASPEEVTMNRCADRVRDLDISKITAVRAAWTSAVKASDIDGLIALATDDIVVVNGNGKAANGVEALRADLIHEFGLFDLELQDASTEIMVHDRWAIEVCEVDRIVSAIKSGRPVQTHCRIIAVFARQSDASWRVARVIGLPG